MAKKIPRDARSPDQDQCGTTGRLQPINEPIKALEIRPKPAEVACCPSKYHGAEPAPLGVVVADRRAVVVVTFFARVRKPGAG